MHRVGELRIAGRLDPNCCGPGVILKSKIFLVSKNFFILLLATLTQVEKINKKQKLVENFIKYHHALQTVL